MNTYRIGYCIGGVCLYIVQMIHMKQVLIYISRPYNRSYMKSQPSVLGPLLFLIYVNDLPNISDKLRFFLFADDTNIYYDSDDLIELENTVNHELRKLSQWLNINRLALNVGKTNFVIFRAKKKIYHNVTLILNRKAIE